MLHECNDCFKTMRLHPSRPDGGSPLIFEGKHCLDTKVTQFFPVNRGDRVALEGLSNIPSQVIPPIRTVAVGYPVAEGNKVKGEAITWCNPCQPPCWETCVDGSMVNPREDMVVSQNLSLTITSAGGGCCDALNGASWMLEGCQTHTFPTQISNCPGCFTPTVVGIGAKMAEWDGETIQLSSPECFTFPDLVEVPVMAAAYAYVTCFQDTSQIPFMCEYWLTVRVGYNLLDVPWFPDGNPCQCAGWTGCVELENYNQQCGNFSVDIGLGCVYGAGGCGSNGLTAHIEGVGYTGQGFAANTVTKSSGEVVVKAPCSGCNRKKREGDAIV